MTVTGKYNPYDLITKTLISCHYYLLMHKFMVNFSAASVTFDTECVYSETSPLFPSSDYSELKLPPISKEYSVIGGPETRYLLSLIKL